MQLIICESYASVLKLILKGRPNLDFSIRLNNISKVRLNGPCVGEQEALFDECVPDYKSKHNNPIVQSRSIIYIVGKHMDKLLDKKRGFYRKSSVKFEIELNLNFEL